MPKSKRDRMVHLTKTKKKGRDLKKKLVEEMRENVDLHRYVYVLEVRNMRNSTLKDVRAEWSASRFVFGKNKVMQIALGRSPETEHATNLHSLSQQVVGNRGVMFTNSGPDDVLKYFKALRVPHFARSGFRATRNVTLPAGPLPATMTVSMEPMLRKLGLPTRIANARLILPVETDVCNKGNILTPEQCKILELLNIQMAVFRVDVVCYWSKDSGKFVELEVEEEKEDGDTTVFRDASAAAALVGHHISAPLDITSAGASDLFDEEEADMQVDATS